MTFWISVDFVPLRKLALKWITLSLCSMDADPSTIESSKSTGEMDSNYPILYDYIQVILWNWGSKLASICLHVLWCKGAHQEETEMLFCFRLYRTRLKAISLSRWSCAFFANLHTSKITSVTHVFFRSTCTSAHQSFQLSFIFRWLFASLFCVIS